MAFFHKTSICLVFSIGITIIIKQVVQLCWEMIGSRIIFINVFISTKEYYGHIGIFYQFLFFRIVINLSEFWLLSEKSDFFFLREMKLKSKFQMQREKKSELWKIRIKKDFYHRPIILLYKPGTSGIFQFKLIEWHLNCYPYLFVYLFIHLQNQP